MTVRNLEFAVNPKSVVVIGASKKPGSVGQVVFMNVVGGGFSGDIWAVNPKYRQIAGIPCYSRVAEVPRVPDLAVIAIPAPAVPTVIKELREKGTRAAIVISAGITERNGLRQAMLNEAKPGLLRIIGPNTIGLMVPQIGLNASFAHINPASGDIALLSQSGAITTSLIDWASDNGIGFSQIISLGDMADVDVGDCLDLLAADANTRAILMYLETIPEPRKFLSAARAASRLKPVIALKPGRHAAAAKAAATHTGALSSPDRVVDAAFKRSGVLRVSGLAELFDATETLAHFPPLESARVAIITNGGGAGVLTVDRLMDLNGQLATLTQSTIDALNRLLPPNWSGSNPIDIVGDATPARYRSALEAVSKDTGTDVILVLHCPTAIASSIPVAQSVASLTQNGMISGKPVLTCWLGEHTAREGRHVFSEAGIASYESPAAAAAAISHLVDWSRAQQALQRVPAILPSHSSQRCEIVRSILRHVAEEGRRLLTEPEAKSALAAYGIDVPLTLVASTAEAVEEATQQVLKVADRAVIKLLSKSVTHKSDVGGVVLNIETPDAAVEAAREMERRIRDTLPDADIMGFVVQPMIRRPSSHELLLGVDRDQAFGPIIMFGSGGTAVEVVKDTAVALPPLDDVLADDLISRTRISHLLEGFRDQKPANRTALRKAILAVSQIVADLPCITAMDINPLLADAEGVIALDVRIEINPERVEQLGPNPSFAIRPYPAEWETTLNFDHGTYLVRPIRPTDVNLYPAFLEKMTAEDLRLRFLGYRKFFPTSMLVRLTQLDYDREMAFVALDISSGELCGIARLSADPDHEVAEYGLVIRSDLKGKGLGWALLKHLIAYSTADGIRQIEGIIARENSAMLTMCRELGFKLRRDPDEGGLVIATLDLSKSGQDV